MVACRCLTDGLPAMMQKWSVGMAASRRPGNPRVIAVGAGFGGLATARGLGRAPVDVLLIDRTNHHLFQPLLYQVAAGILSPGDGAR